MKLKHKDLRRLLREEIFHQLRMDDPGGGLATSLDGERVLAGACSVEDSRVAILVDAYNVLGITNFLPPRKALPPRLPRGYGSKAKRKARGGRSSERLS